MERDKLIELIEKTERLMTNASVTKVCGTAERSGKRVGMMASPAYGPEWVPVAEAESIADAEFITHAYRAMPELCKALRESLKPESRMADMIRALESSDEKIQTSGSIEGEWRDHWERRAKEAEHERNGGLPPKPVERAEPAAFIEHDAPHYLTSRGLEGGA